MYLDALTEFVRWCFALDRTNYARWVPVHLKDMANLSGRHPEIANEFNAGHFTAQKTSRLFSAIALDHAHEQVNARIKGDGGAVGLTDDPTHSDAGSYAGPEVARAIRELQDPMEPVHRDDTEEPLESKRHEENESWQKLFVKDVCSLTCHSFIILLRVNIIYKSIVVKLIKIDVFGMYMFQPIHGFLQAQVNQYIQTNPKPSKGTRTNPRKNY